MTVELLENTEGDSAESPSSIEDLYPYARQIALGLAKRYALSNPDDITQEIVLYVITHDKVMAEWETLRLMEAGVDDDEAKHLANRMRLICRRAGERYCRKELAEAIGYRPEDEAFYSVGQLRILVEWYYREGLTERGSTSGPGERVSTSGDPAHGGNWLVSLLDVQRGLERMPRRYRARLRLRFKDLGQHTEVELAAMAVNLATARGKRERIERLLGTTERAIEGRVNYALTRLQKALGGPSPYRRDRVEVDQSPDVE
jgi:hypothetical protein